MLIWGCLSSSRVGNLNFIDGKMNKMDYLAILTQNLQKSADKLGLGGNYMSQQDNDTKHTAHIVRGWLLYNTPKQLKTPPQSTDLNAIENLWAELDK